MTRPVTIADLWLLSVESAAMLAETQRVMAMRMLGWAGLWSVSPTETRRMIDEKAPAYAAATAAALRAMAAGGRPDQIATAALRPIRATTRSNAARLGKRGPKLPG